MSKLPHAERLVIKREIREEMKSEVECQVALQMTAYKQDERHRKRMAEMDEQLSRLRVIEFNIRMGL